MKLKLKGKLCGEWCAVVEDEKEDDEGDGMEEGFGSTILILRVHD